jgi:hypothetical protein
MIINYQSQYTKLEDLPSLKQGWIRLVHRCIYKDHVDSIRKSGLIFNREATKLSSLQKGACYSDITSMASVYDEKTFWESIHKDDFCCYDNARYADTKIVFDMPLDEFCFLQAVGRFVHGKIDSKYIVGCVSNVNGANKQLQMPEEQVDKAEQKSRNNPPSSAQPNNLDVMITKFLSTRNADRREQIKASLYELMKDNAGEIGVEVNINMKDGLR